MINNKKYKIQWLFYTLFFVFYLCYSQSENQSINVYLLPGQGSDHRIFEKFNFPENYQIFHVKYPIPEKKSTMKKYALKIAEQIDTSGYTILIGVSLGGMLCTELNDIYNIEKTIIISSAKNRDELPFRYRFQKYLPIYKIIPKRLIKACSYFTQGLVEPDRKHNKDTFISMLKAKDPLYFKRTIEIIVKWNRKKYNEKIIHIHGNKDHTLPIRCIKYNILIDKGSHVMTLTRGNEINKIVNLLVTNRKL